MLVGKLTVDAMGDERITAAWLVVHLRPSFQFGMFNFIHWASARTSKEKNCTSVKKILLPDPPQISFTDKNQPFLSGRPIISALAPVALTPVSSMTTAPQSLSSTFQLSQ